MEFLSPGGKLTAGVICSGGCNPVGRLLARILDTLLE